MGNIGLTNSLQPLHKLGRVTDRSQGSQGQHTADQPNPSLAHQGPGSQPQARAHATAFKGVKYIYIYIHVLWNLGGDVTKLQTTNLWMPFMSVPHPLGGTFPKLQTRNLWMQGWSYRPNIAVVLSTDSSWSYRPTHLLTPTQPHRFK